MRHRTRALSALTRKRKFGKRSFTLIELLIVIAIVAVISLVIVFAINPAQTFKQARDSTRFSDLATIHRGLGIFTAEVLNGSFGTASTTYFSIPDPAATTTAGSNCAGLGLVAPSGWSYHCAASSTFRAVDGTGWIPVNFNQIPAKSPFASLPVDPVNTLAGGNFYTYTPGGSWQLTALMESEKYGPRGGANSKTANDNGRDRYLYETGNDLALSPLPPVGDWSFDEGSGGTAYDSSGNGANGTLTNNPTWTTNCKAGGCLSFNGSDQYVDLGNPSQLHMNGATQFTLAAWVKRGTTGGGGIVGNWNTLQNGYLMYGSINTKVDCVAVNTSNAEFYANGGAGITVPLDTWSHFACVLDGSRIRIFLNGAEQASSTFSGTLKYVSQPVRIGRYGDNSYWNGQIDEVRIYNRALSSGEVRALYNASQ